MALAVSPDPVPATHQLMALLEYPELDGFERSVLEWHRDSLARVRASPAPNEWLRWYRDALTAIRQLTSRWQPPKDVPVQPEAPSFNPNAVARIKDSHSSFLQRWNVRLQDQCTTLKAKLLEDVARLPVSESSSETHIQFSLRSEAFVPFSNHVLQVLNSWSTDVESKLTASWHAHLSAVLATEQLGVPPQRPPDWPLVRLGMSVLGPARLDPHAIRRPTILNTFLRTIRSAQSVVTILSVVGASALVVLGREGSPTDKAFLGAAVGGIGVLVGLVAALTFGRKSIRDEVEQARVDERHRLHGIVQTWIATVVEAHRGRMQTLLATTSADARSRLVEWADECWKPAGIPGGARQSPRQSDYAPLLLSLNSVRSALATRAAQLELEINGAARGAGAKDGT